MAYKKSASVSKDDPFRRILEDATKALKEHWVYDIAELFVDCAVATHRLEKMVRRLKNDRGREARNDQKVITEITRLVRFMERWKSLAGEHLIHDLICPDEVERHVEKVRRVSFSEGDRAKMNRRDSKEDFLRSYETINAIRNPNLTKN